MKKLALVAVMTLLLLLAACGGQVKTKPLSAPNGAVTGTPAVTETLPAPQPMQESTGQTAAEAIKNLQIPQPTTTTTKQASTGLPPAPEGLVGKDALNARTKAFYQQSTPVSGTVDADRRTGSIADDLPEGYGNDDSAGE